MSHYRLTNQAVKDLENIWFFTSEKWSIDQADRYYFLIIQEIECIAAHPLSGKTMDHIKEGYRTSKVKSHLIFYKQDHNGVIEIVRILHQRMDVKSRLK